MVDKVIFRPVAFVCKTFFSACRTRVTLCAFAGVYIEIFMVITGDCPCAARKSWADAAIFISVFVFGRAVRVCTWCAFGFLVMIFGLICIGWTAFTFAQSTHTTSLVTGAIIVGTFISSGDSGHKTDYKNG